MAWFAQSQLGSFFKITPVMEYVYILANPEHPGIVKIGKSKFHPDKRANQLTRYSGVLGEFKVEWFKEVEDSTIIEKVLHFVFRKFRFQKEFFALTPAFAIPNAEKVISDFEQTDIEVHEKITNEVTDIIEILKLIEETSELLDNTEKQELLEVISKLKNAIPRGYKTQLKT